MTKTESEAPIRFPSAEIVRALLREGNRVKEETSSIAGRFGDRIKTHQETGNLHGASFRQAGAIYRKAQNNEIKAREHIAHLRYLLDLIEGDLDNRGHVGDLDRMSQAAASKEEEPKSAAAAAEALFKRQDAETEANRAAAREALDLPADGSAGEPAAEAAEKPKRGRKPKAVEAVAEDAAPPPPPAPTLKDDEDEDDIRPGFLKAKEAERKAAAVH